MTHVSVSQIETFRLCRRKWGYTRTEPKRSNAAAERGTLVHEHVEKWFKGTPIQGEHAGMAIALLPHLPSPFPGLLVEDPVTAEFSRIQWVGKIDLWHPESARIWDHKTTSDLKWALNGSQLRQGVQANVYARFGLARTGWHNWNLQWTYVTPARRTLPVVTAIDTRSDEHLTIWAGIEATAAEIVAADPTDQPRTLDACEAYGGCPYREICKPSAEQQFRAIRAQIKKEENTMALRPEIQEKLAQISANVGAPGQPPAPPGWAWGPSGTLVPAGEAPPPAPAPALPAAPPGWTWQGGTLVSAAPAPAPAPAPVALPPPPPAPALPAAPPGYRWEGTALVPATATAAPAPAPAPEPAKRGPGRPPKAEQAGVDMDRWYALAERFVVAVEKIGG